MSTWLEQIETPDLLQLRAGLLAKYDDAEPRDEAGRWTAGLEAHDYAGDVGDRSHITRTEVGRIPTSAIARLNGARGERPGAHRNRQGAKWTTFLNDVRQNGITSPIFITVDPGKAPEINEGNHRRDAALELGMPTVPVEIRYFGHSETQGTVLDRAERVQKFDESEPRDDQGRWTTGVAVPPNGKGHAIITRGILWGYSHGASRQVTSEAATLMGIPGYTVPTTGPRVDWATGNTAPRFLAAIAGDRLGSEEPLYHGFQNLDHIDWKVGDTLMLPTTATAGDRSDAAGYGTRLDPQDQEGAITVFRFPVGTPMAGYSRWAPSDQKEFGHIWSEAIVAGKFEITGVTTEKGVSGHWADPPVTTVDLKPLEVFDPGTKAWSPVQTALLHG